MSYYKISEIVAHKKFTLNPAAWNKIKKYKVTRIIKVGTHGCYWVAPVEFNNADDYYEVLFGGATLANEQDYTNWVTECEHKKLMLTLSGKNYG